MTKMKYAQSTLIIKSTNFLNKDFFVVCFITVKTVYQTNKYTFEKTLINLKGFKNVLSYLFWIDVH